MSTLSPVDVPAAELTAAAAALKALAADPGLRAGFLRSAGLRRLLAAPASRYIVAADRPELWPRLSTLSAKGYRLGVEYVGEEVTDPAEIEGICREYLAVIAEADRPVQLGFDLSNVGLLVSRELAIANTERILRAAAERDLPVVLSMERSDLVEAIIGVFAELAPRHDNLGLTMQAHLYRTDTDLVAVARPGRRIRLVKGVYREAGAVAMPRGPALNERYAALAETLLDRGVLLACGTHDAALLSLLDRRGITGRLAEIEMLHGQQPALLRRYRERGVPCRVAAVYGANWWLHFLHRLSEYPRNVFTALADLAEPGRIRFGGEY